MAKATLSEWLVKIETCHPKTIDMGLHRMRAMIDKLHIAFSQSKVITVAGTNGKGSTVALIESICRHAHLRVGSLTSPHLFQFNERIKIDMRPVSDEALCEAFAIIDAARGDMTLTYFEFTTLAAFVIFQQHDLDVILLEVGMGGRLDAVNVIDADVSVITSIARDHEAWLGDTREAIGLEKAGIFRADKPAVLGMPLAQVPRSVIDYAEQLATPLMICDRDYEYSVNDDKEREWCWTWSGQWREYRQLPRPNIALSNAACALQAIDCIVENYGIGREHCEAALRDVRLMGRYQALTIPLEQRFDVAHNPQAAQYLASRLAEDARPGARTLAVVGILADKDIAGILSPLIPYVDQWVIGGIPGLRGTTASQLGKHLASLGVHNPLTFLSVERAYQQAVAQSRKHDKLLVFGSFVTVAKALRQAMMWSKQKTDHSVA